MLNTRVNVRLLCFVVEKRLRAVIRSQLDPYTPVHIQLAKVNRIFFCSVDTVLKEFDITDYAVETTDLKKQFKASIIFRPYEDAELITMSFNVEFHGYYK